MYSYVCLPLLSSFHLRCQDFFAISDAILRASEIEITFDTEVFWLATVCAICFAFWSASSFPCIPLCPGIFTSFIILEVSAKNLQICRIFTSISGCLFNFQLCSFITLGLEHTLNSMVMSRKLYKIHFRRPWVAFYLICLLQDIPHAIFLQLCRSGSDFNWQARRADPLR